MRRKHTDSRKPSYDRNPPRVRGHRGGYCGKNGVRSRVGKGARQRRLFEQGLHNIRKRGVPSSMRSIQFTDEQTPENLDVFVEGQKIGSIVIEEVKLTLSMNAI